MLRKFAAGLFGLALLTSGSAGAASDVSNNGGLLGKLLSSVTAPIASTQTSTLISNAISGGLGSTGASGGLIGPTGFSSGNTTSYLNSRDTGRNAGAIEKPFGIWAQGAYTNIDNSQVGASAEGDVYNLVAGFDYKPTERMVIGITGIYETIDLDTGTLGGRGSLKEDGFGIAPYLGYQLTDRWTASLSGGYSWLNYDSKRNNDTVSGSYDATRWFANASLSGVYASGNFRFLPMVGVLYLEEEQDGYTESTGTVVGSNTIKLGRLSAGGRVGYVAGNMMPYVKLIGEYDFEHPDAVAIGNGTFSNDDDTGGQIGVGVDFFSTGPLSGTVEASYNSLGRTDLDVWSLMGRLRMRF